MSGLGSALVIAFVNMLVRLKRMVDVVACSGTAMAAIEDVKLDTVTDAVADCMLLQPLSVLHLVSAIDTSNSFDLCKDQPMD